MFSLKMQQLDVKTLVGREPDWVLALLYTRRRRTSRCTKQDCNHIAQLLLTLNAEAITSVIFENVGTN
jgi:precorrin-6B methylase 1